MLRSLALVLALMPAVVTSAARAEDAAVVAEYWTDSGSLPPEYAWATTVVIRADGQLLLKRCTGYETEGPACKTRKAKVETSALGAIRAAALASGLAENPARQSDYPMVGGSVTGGAVHLDGVLIALPSDPAEMDAPRVAGVLAAIRAAIPKRLNRFLAD